MSFIFSKKELQIGFMDVGQGDSALILTPNKASIMIDTGQEGKILYKYKDFLGHNKDLDLIILTHEDSDHIGDYFEMIEFSSNLKLLGERFVEKYGGQSLFYKDKIFSKDGVKLEIIWPPKNLKNLQDNQKSLVISINYGRYNFIFTGDIDKEIERKIVSNNIFDKNKITILKVAHHGSKTSSSELFLKKLKPEYCVISVGRNNIYNHPDAEVIQRLEKYCKSISVSYTHL
ncbi:MAG: MBL fold metallo-hydrolase, partial [Patescibacteria group bacterium]|nr:MBL fold metallo-hydrolase [Patescibacteria group bacterium]